MFARFTQAGSVRQTLLWFRREQVELPAAVYEGTRRSVVCKLPTYNTVLHILANPVYAGAYAFGRTETRVRLEAGRKRSSARLSTRTRSLAGLSLAGLDPRSPRGLH